MANKVEKIVENAVTPVLESLGVELVDVDYRTRDGEINITVFIYKEGGTDLDTCETVHRAIDGVLDDADPTQGAPYILNVSSPGLDRAFKTDRDYMRNIGCDVEIKFFSPYNGEKRIEAKLLSYDGNCVKVEYDGRETAIKLSRIAKMNCAIKF